MPFAQQNNLGLTPRSDKKSQTTRTERLTPPSPKVFCFEYNFVEKGFSFVCLFDEPTTAFPVMLRRNFWTTPDALALSD